MVDKPLVWLHGEVTTPPFSKNGRTEAGGLLRRLQRGEALAMPHSKPMPTIGKRCHELRIIDGDSTWRIVYYVGVEAVVILAVFAKKTQATPPQVITASRKRLKQYQTVAE